MKYRVPYEISNDKRFAISPDEYSRERIQAIKNVFDELKKDIPFDIGFSLYGSLSKGKSLDQNNALDADIDLSVYVDSDDIERSFLGYAQSNNIPSDSDDPEANKTQIRELIRKRIQSRLNQLPSNGELTKNIWMYDIAKSDISALVKNVDEYSEWDKSFELRKLVRLFHLDVGGGMKKYRVSLLNYLLTQPEDYRERIWSKIIETLKIKERGELHGSIPPTIQAQYPATFDEAYLYYVGKQ